MHSCGFVETLHAVSLQLVKLHGYYYLRTLFIKKPTLGNIKEGHKNSKFSYNAMKISSKLGVRYAMILTKISNEVLYYVSLPQNEILRCNAHGFSVFFHLKPGYIFINAGGCFRGYQT